MKKQISVLFMAAAMAGLLTACGSSSGDAGKGATTAAAAVETTAGASSEKKEETQAPTTQDGAAGAPLIMVTNAEFPPYEYHDGGEIVGIDVEVSQAIAEKLGRTLEIEDIAFDSIIPELQSGKADFGAAGMTVDEDRLKNVDFSDTYTTASQVIIVKDDSDIAGPDDLKGKYIGVQLGTTGDIYASDYEEEGSTIERYNKGFEAVQAMMQGKIDAVVIDNEPAKVFVSQNQGIKILDEALTVEEYAIAVKKGNTELLEQINKALAELKESGELQAIIDKYISAE
ncbi:MAG: basic amino acid ABC transporter substrate-binding protein [Hungatella sp.]|nr:basic amino acid ABC transporter substrate-binding protein [Hungatella sp.]